MKEIKMYEALDGKIFKSKKGAENHNKKILVKQKVEELGMTEEEIAEKLAAVANTNRVVKFLLEENPWTKWRENHIRLISNSLLHPPKKTLFYAEKEFYGREKYKEIAEDKGDSFSESDKYLGLEKENHLEYVLEHEDMKDENTKLVYYKLKHSYEDRFQMKLEDESQELTEQEIRRLVSDYSIYYEEGEEHRWDREMLTVSKVGDKLYAVSWRQGLTENQEDWYDNQPYEVTMEEKEVVVKAIKTVITPVK